MKCDICKGKGDEDDMIEITTGSIQFDNVCDTCSNMVDEAITQAIKKSDEVEK